MTDADRKRALRGVSDMDKAALARGEVTGNAWRLAWTRGNGSDDAAAFLTEMLEAARDPREAAVDAKLAEFRKGKP